MSVSRKAWRKRTRYFQQFSYFVVKCYFFCTVTLNNTIILIQILHVKKIRIWIKSRYNWFC